MTRVNIFIIETLNKKHLNIIYIKYYKCHKNRKYINNKDQKY